MVRNIYETGVCACFITVSIQHPVGMELVLHIIIIIN